MPMTPSLQNRRGKVTQAESETPGHPDFGRVGLTPLRPKRLNDAQPRPVYENRHIEQARLERERRG